LFGDVGGGAGTAGWVEDEVAWVGGHEDAALNELCSTLHDVDPHPVYVLIADLHEDGPGVGQ